MTVELVHLIENYLDNYCQTKNYQVTKTQNKGDFKYEISNGYEKISLMLYHTGRFVPGGSPKLNLRKEFDELKTNVTNSPEILSQIEELRIKYCAQKYVMIVDSVKEEIKKELDDIDGTLTIEENPSTHKEYRAKIIREEYSLTVTQYTNGTLFLQGKEDKLFNDVCDIIEKIGAPSEREVITRFLSHDEEVLQKFTASWTLELLETAENNIKGVLQDAYLFLEPYDQKWFVAAKCLCMAGISLPEYSPIVMPASKAFEGFAKKLLLAVGFYPPTHFSKKEEGFTNLMDKTYSGRKTLISKEKYAGSYINKLAVALDMTRNFMMHSDGSTVTKVNTPQEASDKLDDILKNTKEFFGYFNKPEFGKIYP